MKKNLVVAFVFVLAGMPLRAAESGHEKTERTLTVQGQGKASSVPDIATLSVEVSHDGADMDSVSTQVRQDMNKILEVVKAQAIADKDVQTELFQVHPKYEQDKHYNPHPVGFTVANRISVKVRDLKKVGKVLSAVLKAGATNVDGPNFEVDKPEALEAEALAAATKDARVKAQAVAEAAGVQLGEIISINPQTVNWPMPLRRFPMMHSMAAPAAMGDQEPMATGEQQLNGNVTITYAIR